MRKSGKRGLYAALTALLALFCALVAGIGLVYCGSKLLRLPSIGLFAGLAALYLAFGAGLWLAWRKGPRSPWAQALLVFAVAFALRAAFGLLHRCEPMSDFADYAASGRMLLAGDTEGVRALVERRGLDAFAGIGLVNALLGAVFSPTPAGWAMGDALLTALIAVCVWALGARYSRGVGLCAALLYAVYPAAIVSAQLMTNQHAATLLALLSLLCLLRAADGKALPRALAWVALSALLLTLSEWCHPSTLPTRIAAVAFVLAAMLGAKRERVLRLLALLCCFVLALFGAARGTDALMRGAGLTVGGQDASTTLSHIVVGLNPETAGGYSLEDYRRIDEAPQSERTALCLSLIAERAGDVPTALRTLAKKFVNMWVKTDNTFLFYLDTTEDTALGTLIVDIEALDAIFLTLLYALAALSLWLERRSHTLDLTVWVLLGWYGANMLNEAQSRYRYFAMPLLMVLAALGVRKIVLIICNKRAQI
ncbi:MAG: glycosyltransferase family 39 protein [Eubacteriales bacterium]|nr:glycosyltransferase family 39 protein [Eubacteriales bacterium]